MSDKDLQHVDGAYDDSQIQILEGLEAVRVRPSMYIGSTSLVGLHHLISEIVDNSIDEALAGYATHIEVVIHKDHSVTITDDGRGMPVGMNEKLGISTVEVIHTVLHAGGKFGGGGYKVSGGLHGVGASVVNALSTWMKVEVSREGKVHTQEFRRGIPQGPLKITGEAQHTGTQSTFLADAQIFDTLDYDYDILAARLRELAFLNKGLRISITEEREETPLHETFCYEGGIMEYVEFMNRNKEPLHSKVIYMEAVLDTMEVELALQYTAGFVENISSYANNIVTKEGGMHLEGFRRALTKVLNDYGKRFGYIKDGDKLSGEDVREGLTAIVSVKLQEPQFEGQTKQKLGNSEARTVVDQITTEKLSEYLEENPKLGKQILEKGLMAARAREAARKAREISRKSVLESTTLPGKLSDCRSKDPKECEIYLVEGDSAGGTAKTGRDSHFQAVLPLRGKIINVEKQRLDRILSSDSIQNMVAAFGAGVGNEFDLEKLRYDRIIIMTDADVDGAHIRTLLLTFFYRYMRPLIDNGHIYMAMPPLYKVTKGKQHRYAYDDEQKEQVMEEMGGKESQFEIQRYKGLGEMTEHQLWETTMDPSTRTLRRANVDDAKVADEILTILMGEKVEPRREFIEKNANKANIDV
ncbi:DNA gyrase subunit B [Clostridiaceae bacterium JG1575]|nr:DNA gyrase subunit B [Clostridiaceae bacterium JG1575]